MRYYKILDGDTLLIIGIGCGGDEITESEYRELFAQIAEKSRLVAMLFKGEISLDDVPSQWRDEVQRRVDERKANAALVDEVSAEDALAELMEVLS